MSALSRIAWREFRQRPSRTLLTLASVSIGVAAVVAVSLAASTSSRAFDAIFATIAGRADLEITAPVGVGFDESIVAQVRDVPGVEAVAPLMERWTVLYFGKRHVQSMALGIDPELAQSVHGFTVVEGKSLEEEPGIMLDATFAHNLGIKVGEQVDLQTRRGFQRTHVVGVFKQKEVAVGSEATALLMQLPAAQYLFKSPKKIDSAQLILKPGADADETRLAIAKLLPEGVTVQRPGTRNPIAEETSLSTQQGMLMARAFSLLVATFIIANTLLMNVAQRRRQLGIMRAIGATRGQIIRMILSEALRLSAVGTVIGSLLGVVAAHYLNNAMGTLYSTTLPPIQLTWKPFLLAAVCGLGISLIAAVLPAWRAGRLSPLEAMRDVLPDEMEGISWPLVMAGLLLLALAIGILALSIWGWLPIGNSVWGATIMLLALALLLPLVLSPLSSLVASLLAPFAGVEGRLARLQLLRHNSRTTLTVGGVFVGMAAGIGLASAVIDNVENVRNWYRKAIVADFFVRAMAPDMSSGLAADLPDGVGASLERVPGITSLEGVRFVSLKAAGERAILVARDHFAPDSVDLDVIDGDPSKLQSEMHNGAVAVGSVLAERSKLKVGDNIALETEGGKREFRIAAIINDYQGGGLTIHMERSVARRELGVAGVDAYVVKAKPTEISHVGDALQEIAQKNGLLLQTSVDIQRTIDGMMSGVVAALWAMVVLLLGVAAIGVTNTLTINVLEQTREIGLLRVVAMTQAQVRRMVLTQALIMAVLALVPAVAAGVMVSYFINLATYSVTGHTVQFTFHPELLAGSLLVGFIVVGLAAWLPASRAARLHLPTALQMS